VKAVTVEQMCELDRRTIAAGTTGEELMERAGFAVAKAASGFLKRRDSRSALLFAGKGNNGSDAIVAARHLAAAGCSPTLVVIEARELPALAGVQILRWPSELPDAAVIVDGLLGIGLKGEVREPYASAIQSINQSRLPVVAIDVPSGLGTTTCVRADVTVTMGLPKIDLLRPAAADFVGRIEVADIGLIDDVASDIEMISRADIVLPDRRRSAHKGDFGHLLIIAGAEGYTGAPVLAAHAAARAGAGLVTLAVPREIYPIVAGKCPPEVMPQPLTFEQVPPGFDAVAIGPGLGQKPETQKLIWKLLSNSPVPTVVDADALNALAQAPAALKKMPVPLVLTPHPGEMARLVGRSAKEVQTNRWETARRFSQEYGVVLALKGAGTVVTDKSGNLWINSTGNAGMAKGGMGDALTGIIGALLAQRMTPLEAAKAGVFWHGLAGDVAAEKCGEASMLATDLIEALGPAWHIRAA
jgi:ADP-dependent NAD(P)H-hydrate dehydratase / NAD(P)H-hydrate epimerase